MKTVALLAVLWLAGAADAQGRIQDRPNQAEADHAIDQLRSPYCPGFMLRICTSSQAAELRDSIYNLAAEGMTSDQLVEWMIGRHGEEWRAVPKRSGAGLFAWVIPPVVVLLAVAGVVVWVRGHRRPEEENGALLAISDAERAQLSDALREWEEEGGEEA
jgi:cytochrome c-type biogenesis protein CcmH